MLNVRRKIIWGLTFILAVGFISIISACGGGGSGSAGTPAVTKGVVTGFGSIFIDGQEFQTDAVTLRRHLDDGPEDLGDDDQLIFIEGMVVSVHHRAGSNKATRIDFVNDLEGPVANATATSFTVFGVLVTINPDTVIHPSSTPFVNGAIAEVSGLPDTSGAIPATYIELNPAGSKDVFEIKGFTSNLDPVNQTFSLGVVQGSANTIEVSYATAVLDDNLGSTLSDNLFVEVKTDLAGSTTLPLTATVVELGLESEFELENEF